MKIVGQIGSNICSESGYQIPGLLGPRCGWRYLSKFVAREKPSDIGLDGRNARELVHTVATHEVPILAEVVIEPSHPKVTLYRSYDGSLEALRVVRIAETEVGRMGHVL